MRNKHSTLCLKSIGLGSYTASWYHVIPIWEEIYGYPVIRCGRGADNGDYVKKILEANFKNGKICKGAIVSICVNVADGFVPNGRPLFDDKQTELRVIHSDIDGNNFFLT